MLGILSVVLLVAGTFAAGGGAFDWEFLFSDGYREHDWVRSLGRGGARGLLMLLGGVLVVVGFVGQVVDNAAKPAVAANTQDTFDSSHEPAWPSGSSGSSSSETSQPGRSGRIKAPEVARPSQGSATLPRASQSTAATGYPPPTPGTKQPVTVWNPQLEFNDEETMIRLQYRFEPGHEPVPGAQYLWLIELSTKTTEVPREALQNEGQFEHVLRLPQPEKTFGEAWSTLLMVESNGKRTQVSNRLDIARGQVRSTPLEVPN